MEAQITPNAPGSRAKRVAAVGLPLLVALLVLLAMNAALYARLSPSQSFAALTPPFTTDFSDTKINKWFTFGGDWQVADGVLVQQKPDAKDALIFVPLKLDNGQAYKAGVKLALEDTKQSAGLSFNAQYPRLQQSRHVVTLAASDGRWQLTCGYLQGSVNLKSQAVVPLDSPVGKPFAAAPDCRCRQDGLFGCARRQGVGARHTIGLPRWLCGADCLRCARAF